MTRRAVRWTIQPPTHRNPSCCRCTRRYAALRHDLFTWRSPKMNPWPKKLLARQATEIAASQAAQIPQLETVPWASEALETAKAAIQRRAEAYPAGGERSLCSACWMRGNETELAPIDSGESHVDLYRCNACGADFRFQYS